MWRTNVHSLADEFFAEHAHDAALFGEYDEFPQEVSPADLPLAHRPEVEDGCAVADKDPLSLPPSFFTVRCVPSTVDEECDHKRGDQCPGLSSLTLMAPPRGIQILDRLGADMVSRLFHGRCQCLTHALVASAQPPHLDGDTVYLAHQSTRIPTPQIVATGQQRNLYVYSRSKKTPANAS